MMKERTYTLEQFMKEYKGFNWVEGIVIIVIHNTPYICTGCWESLIERHRYNNVIEWTHDDDKMVVVLS